MVEEAILRLASQLAPLPLPHTLLVNIIRTCLLARLVSAHPCLTKALHSEVEIFQNVVNYMTRSEPEDLVNIYATDREILRMKNEN